MRPRDHHYFFAHSYFRQLALERTEMVLFSLGGKTGRDFLLNWWYQVPRYCSFGKKPMEILLPKGLTYSFHEVESGKILLVQLPKPLHMTEAYFIALYYSAISRERRYFTLEYHDSVFEQQIKVSKKAILCEWSESAHLNYGQSVNPDIDSFMGAVMEKLRKEHDE